MTTTASSSKLNKIIVIHGGDVASDVAQQLQHKLQGCNFHGSVELVSASKSPKSLVADRSSTTLHCLIFQTIENAAPSEDGGATYRFFQRKTHATDLLAAAAGDNDNNNNNNAFLYTVLGLGDSNLLMDRQTTTAKDCNQVAQKLDQRLEELSATRFYELGLADERTDFVEVEPWIEGLCVALQQ